MDFTVTADWLVIVGASVLSLGFSLIPGLNVWFAAKSSEVKQLTMAILILVIVGVAFALQCGGITETGLVCTSKGAYEAVTLFIFAVAANQGIYKITPITDAIKAVKLAR